jgi:Xaa-Pro aminopeptidase
MLFAYESSISLQEYKERRTELCHKVQQEGRVKSGVIVLIANFDDDVDSRYPIVQERNFYYYTGVELPGAVLVLEFSGKTTLYIQNNSSVYQHFTEHCFDTSKACAERIGVDEIKYLGEDTNIRCMSPFVSVGEYGNFIVFLQKQINQGKKIVTGYPLKKTGYVLQKCLLNHLSKNFVYNLDQAIVDCSDLIISMRLCKTDGEIQCMRHAHEISEQAHRALAQAVLPGKNEGDLDGVFRTVCKLAGTELSYPPIIASGKNGTILHYNTNDQPLVAGDLIVVDAGLHVDYGCTDITRTYPVSGRFTARQKKLYQYVLDCQTYIASIAKPGMYVKNPKHPDKCLNTLAHKFLAEYGVDQYFSHSLGHYLGTDVHDVGDYSQPLAVGNVFTIEPGVYIADESVGIRIEDNYLVTEDGVTCLSESLPKSIEAIEEMVSVKI